MKTQAINENRILRPVEMTQAIIVLTTFTVIIMGIALPFTDLITRSGNATKEGVNEGQALAVSPETMAEFLSETQEQPLETESWMVDGSVWESASADRDGSAEHFIAPTETMMEHFRESQLLQSETESAVLEEQALNPVADVKAVSEVPFTVTPEMMDEYLAEAEDKPLGIKLNITEPVWISSPVVKTSFIAGVDRMEKYFKTVFGDPLETEKEVSDNGNQDPGETTAAEVNVYPGVVIGNKTAETIINQVLILKLNEALEAEDETPLNLESWMFNENLFNRETGPGENSIYNRKFDIRKVLDQLIKN